MDPSPEAPLRGRCACGAVQFEITAPMRGARYCHCHRCQQRTGSAFSVNAELDASAYRLLSGADRLAFWQPPDGQGKWFCRDCGGHLYSRRSPDAPVLYVRLGTIDGDPGVRPQWHQWVSSAAPWEPLPDDGLPRHPDGPPPAR
jgi:hypothetical protein